jgi:hypothetical protein
MLSAGVAEEPTDRSAGAAWRPGGSVSLGVTHQPGTGLESGGETTSTGFSVRSDLVTRIARPGRIDTLAGGVGVRDLSVSGPLQEALGGADPERIHSVDLSWLGVYPLAGDWSLAARLGGNWAWEDGAAWERSGRGAGLVTAAWQATPDLRLLAGFFYASLRYESDRAFPIVGFDWRLSPRIRLATTGPGLRLDADLGGRHRLAASVQWSGYGVRLDDQDGSRPGGLVEEAALLRLEYAWAARRGPQPYLAAGLEFAGKVSVYDGQRQRIFRDDKDEALVVEVGLRLAGGPPRRP